jgi:NAD(P)-dependent dehydrogenase (short-subunit alcohol dehydrogenase family)
MRNVKVLSCKRIAVTGALGGIGKNVISELSALGAQVVAIDLLDQASGEKQLSELHLENVQYISADLTAEEEIKSLIDNLNEQDFPDALVALAGVVVSGNLIEQSTSDIKKVIDVNLTSQIILSQNFLKQWSAKNIAGNIVFVSSWVDHVPWPGITPYTASKAGLVALCRGIAREYANKGIRSNLISPGIVDVGMAAKQWREEDDYRARARRAIPLGRLQQPEEVAGAISFLLSPAAEYMTGSNLLIDGGASLYPMDPEEI